MRLVEKYEYKIGIEISNIYWDCPTDHEDYDKILNAIDRGGGQTCDIVGIVKELYKAGFVIRKIK